MASEDDKYIEAYKMISVFEMVEINEKIEENTAFSLFRTGFLNVPFCRVVKIRHRLIGTHNTGLWKSTPIFGIAPS